MKSRDYMESVIGKNRPHKSSNRSTLKHTSKIKIDPPKAQPFYSVKPSPTSVPPAGLQVPIFKNQLYRPPTPIFPPSQKWTPIPWSPIIPVPIPVPADSTSTPAGPLGLRISLPLRVPLTPAQLVQQNIVIPVPAEIWAANVRNAPGPVNESVGSTSVSSTTVDTILVEVAPGISQRALREPKRNVFAPRTSQEIQSLPLLDPRRLLQCPVGPGSVEKITGHRVLMRPANTSFADALP